jgi:uncharacterized protein YbbK (DUF523 family)
VNEPASSNDVTASAASHASDDDEIRVGISSCLLGEEVRFDGGHKRDGFILGTLSPFFRFVSVCPEVEIGLGTPREAIRLVRDGDTTRLVSKSGLDLTERMTTYARTKVAALERLSLSGYLLKSASPSCGMERVRVHEEGGTPRRDGRGLFARELLDALPLLPVEEEGRLHDPKLRENFFDRVFGYHRLRRLLDGSWTVGDLVAFHTGE